MRNTKEVLRLSLADGRSQREIAACLGIGKTTVQEIIARQEALGLTWEKAQPMKEIELVETLFPTQVTLERKADANWSDIRQELLKKGVTLQLLWMEYREENPEGLGYSRFCERFRAWEKRSRLVMRQHYKAGERVFVDFSGLTVPWLNLATGEVKTAEIFLGVLGASNFTFALAVEDQSLPSWVHCHIKTFEFFGGVPELIIPDNLKSGVTRACRYEPDINPTFQRMAEHYSTAVLPARAYKPKDKAKVEVGVQIVQRWILAKLRKLTFTSVAEINASMTPLLTALNDKIMRHLGASRRELFEKYERAELKPLPKEPFEISTWKKAKVNIDYHVEVERHYYSVPFRYVGMVVEISFTRNKVEIFSETELISFHKRSTSIGKHTTIREHMPPQHASLLEWSPDRILSWARDTGPETAKLCERIMGSRNHVEQGFRACLGVMRLGKKYSKERVEAACTRALKMDVPTYTSVKAILKNNLDRLPAPEKPHKEKTIEISHHENIRGGNYYH